MSYLVCVNDRKRQSLNVENTECGGAGDPFGR